MLKPAMLNLKTPRIDKFNTFWLFNFIYLKIYYKISKKWFKSNFFYTNIVDRNNNTSQKWYYKYYQNMSYFNTFCLFVI